jgi:hypothetical protein
VKLSVDAFFVGLDVMIAKRGQEYFEQCWRSDGVEETVEFAISIFSGTNHDSVLFDEEKGALKNVFERIVQLRKDRD